MLIAASMIHSAMVGTNVVKTLGYPIQDYECPHEDNQSHFGDTIPVSNVALTDC